MKKFRRLSLAPFQIIRQSQCERRRETHTSQLPQGDAERHKERVSNNLLHEICVSVCMRVVANLDQEISTNERAVAAAACRQATHIKINIIIVSERKKHHDCTYTDANKYKLPIEKLLPMQSNVINNLR
jgi:hypothetical protein